MDLCKALFIKHMSKEANEAPSSPPTAYDAGIQGLAKTQVRLVVVSIVWNVVVVLQVSRGLPVEAISGMRVIIGIGGQRLRLGGIPLVLGVKDCCWEAYDMV